MVETSGAVSGEVLAADGGRRGTFTDGVADDCAFWKCHFGKLSGIKSRRNVLKMDCRRL